MAYADEEMQRNAALTGQDDIYVITVLTELRNEYALQLAQGKTSFVIPKSVSAGLDAIKPW
jgi:hypothetical protein